MRIDREKKDLVSVREAADYMCVSTSCIYTMIYNGTIPTLRIGNTYRIRKEWIQDYLRGGMANE